MKIKDSISFLLLIFLISKSHAASESDLSDQNPDKILAQNNKNILTFNSASLFGGQSQSVDLSIFRSANYVAEGTYIVDTTVNDRQIGELKLLFKHLDSNPTAVLCVDADILNRLDLQPQYLASLAKKDCLTIKDISPDAYYDFDLSTQKIAIYIPQKFVIDRPQGYIDPVLFDSGIASAFVGYNANFNQNDQKNSKYLALTAGLNVDGWYFRHAGNFDSKDSSLGRYHSYQNVLYRDITAINARISGGQFNTSSLQNESLPIVGIQLASDLSMLPWSMRSYAPVIENIANTNALVRVFQNGQKIYERTVPAGPFRITDLTSFASGVMTLEIIENGGEKKTYIIPVQNNVNLLKTGQKTFSIALGNYKTIERMTNDSVLQSSYNYGLNNYLTVLSGLNLTQDYQGILLGAGLNTFFGGVSIKANSSHATWRDQDYRGQKIALDYSYYLPTYKINFYASAQKQTKKYFSVSNLLSYKNYDYLNINELKDLYLTADLKNQYNFSLSKSFDNPKIGAFSVGFLVNDYWNSLNNRYQYNLSYGNSWKRLSYSIGLSQTNYKENTFGQERSVYASLSLPLDFRKSNLNLNSTYQNDKQQGRNSDSFGTYLSGTAGYNNNLNFGLGTTSHRYDGRTNTSYNGNVNYLLPHVSLGATIYQSNQDTQYSISAQGAVVAHRYGITATNTATDTYTIIHVDQGAGASIDNAWGIKLDHWGNAIYPNASAYSVNTISINPNQLPPEITLDGNQTQVIPRMYSSTLATFKANQQSNILMRIHGKKALQFPMGSRIETLNGKLIGLMGQSNQSLLTHDIRDLKTSLKVVWGDQSKQSCNIPLTEFNSVTKKNKSHLEIIVVECH
ncbi:thin pilus assembly outer membrane usher AcuC [Acinetobacter baumannii]|nr:thin pilus assembly outer membrane usher AcuC [Acinetobacter baumannii]EKV3724057.1 thin pilus assembly outer membrane usher AcuC [Acinetobacter baumannii]EKV9197546.1 thin pilus assembly outer membrane usher AcuC [Acinetobacter baumannii]EKW7907865.1 thin pilus assembly outer membrane usher AcuC [Acinetobacter baumannii]EKW7941466.1 thin pilus assembly outer membrane usher AcuC [Acinetobacter baumannii]